MRQFVVRYLHRIATVIAFVRHEKPGLLQTWNGAAKRTADVVEVEVRRRIRIQRPLGITDSLLILNGESGESRVLVVVESRAMQLVRTALGGDANARNASIFCAEIIGQDI